MTIGPGQVKPDGIDPPKLQRAEQTVDGAEIAILDSQGDGPRMTEFVVLFTLIFSFSLPMLIRPSLVASQGREGWQGLIVVHLGKSCIFN